MQISRKSRSLLFLTGIILLLMNNLLFGVSSPRTGVKMPPVVVDFLKFQQPRYAENDLAVIMQKYRQDREASQKGNVSTVQSLSTLSFKVPVLVGKFSDSGADQWKTSELEKELFKGPWTTGTMRAFYQEISYHQFDLDGTVYGWYTTSQNRNYYGKNVYGLPSQGGRTPEFIRSLIASADASVDFSKFDNDGDGYVETIFIVHYGQGAEGYIDPSTHTNEIWSHQSKLSYWTSQGGAYKTNDKTSANKDVYVDSYVIQPAISSDGSSMIEIGVFCHEFGHALGLPDLYDYDGSSEGIGHWGLMASGGWNTPSSPAHMSAWSKIKLGWIVPVLVTHDMIGATILNVEQNTAVHKLWTYGSYSGKEYFLVENRQAVGFDKNLHSAGILIWHIDETVKTNDKENHKMVDLAEADGLNHLDYASNRGDGGDCYPGSSNNLTFDNTSNPNSRNYSGNNTHCAVQNISTANLTMTADLLVGTPELKVDLVVKDGPNDNGNEPSPTYPWWTESDIWIDNNSDGKADLPAQGMDNLLWARVFNYGSEDAANISVKFYQSYPAMGLLFPSKAQYIDAGTISLIKKNQGSDKVSVKWNIPKPPANIDHYCIGVIAENDKDKPTQEKARYENNLAHINYVYLVKKAGQVTPADNLLANTSPGFESIFIIYNPRDQTWNYRIYIDQNSLRLPSGWHASITPEYVTLEPGQRQEGFLTITVRQAQHGDSGLVSIVLEDNEYHTIEGGVNFACIVDDVPPVAPEGLNAHSHFDRRNLITPGDPTVRLNWPWFPEDIRGATEEIIYYKIYRSTRPTFRQLPITLVDSTAIDEEPDEPGFQWYDTVDPGTGPYFYALTAVDAAGNESGMGNISPVQVPLFGIVMYYSDPPRPIPEATVRLDDITSQLTNPDGFFEFFNIPSGNHKLTVSRHGQERQAIDDNDVMLLLQHLAFLINLDELQLRSANVVPNSEITGADALALQRYLNQLSSLVGTSGNWWFEPPQLDFDLVIGKMANFIGLVMGDINRSWGTGQASLKSPPFKRLPVSLKINKVPDVTVKYDNSVIHGTEKNRSANTIVAFPSDLELKHGTMAEIPIIVSTDSNIGLIQFVVEYDSTVMEFVEAHPGFGAPDFQITAINTHLPFPPSNLQVNKNVLVQLTGNGTHYFTGTERPVCFISYRIIGSVSQTTPLAFDQISNHTFLVTENLVDLTGLALTFIDSKVTVTGIGDDIDNRIPEKFALYQNYPNPFNPETIIRFDLPGTSHISFKVILAIYNSRGQLIRKLLDAEKIPGVYTVCWDGKDNRGARVSSGVYLYTISAGEFSQTRKMIILR